MCSSAVEILPNLWLGNVKASRNRDFLHTYKINVIVNCTKNFDFDSTAILPETKKIRLAVSDTNTPEANRDMLALLDRAVTYIHRQLTRGDHVLVHCYAGKQRSPAVIAAFIVKYCEWPLDKSLKVIERLWNGVYPDHYLSALKEFQSNIKN
jgi:protein-tyrosine phosphatase